METCCGIRTALRVLAFCGAVGAAAGLASAQQQQPGTNKAPTAEKFVKEESPDALKARKFAQGLNTSSLKSEIAKNPELANLLIARGPGANNCASAAVVNEGVHPWDNTAATTDGPVNCGAIGNDVWFNYVATSTGTATVSTCGQTGTDTVLSVYDGAACTGPLIVCLDDFCGLQTSVTFAVTAGNTYKVQLGGFGGAVGAGTVTISLAGPLANDNCASAIAIADGTTPFDTTGATTDGSAEASCLFFGQDQTFNDIWYTYVATADTIEINLCGSAYDTKIVLYDGASCVGTKLGCNDDSCGLQSAMVVSGLTVGNSYKLRVGSFSAVGQGSGTITIGPFSAPTCGDCAGADVIEGEVDCGIAAGCTGPDCDTVNGGCNSVPPVFTSLNVGDSVCGTGAFDGAFRDTDWYQFTLATATEVMWSVNAEFDVLVGFIDLNAGCPAGAFIPGTAFTATAAPCASISTVFCFPPGTYVAFVAPLFTATIPCGGGFGDYTAELSATGGLCTATPPANNACADAIVVTDGVTAFDTAFATTDGPASCGLIANDIWFLYTATSTGATQFSLCGSAYDTVLAIYDAPCIGGELGCDDDTCAAFGPSQLNIPTTAGNQYLVRIGGFNGGTGTGVLTIGPFVAPTCGDCTGSETVQENEGDCGIATGCTGPDCDTVNGGCNSVPPVFTTIACGATVCGSGAFNGAFRDTDWYQFTLTQDTEVTWTVNSEFDVLVGFIDLNAGCPAGAFIPGTALTAVAAPCAQISTVACLGPGTWVAFVAPLFTVQVPCGGGFGDYTAAMTCVGCDLPDPPANDQCANAAPVAIGSTTAGTTVGATADATPVCGPGAGTPGVWYTVVGNGQTLTASLCGSPNPAFDTVLSIFCGSCDSLTCVASDDDSCPETGIGNSVVSFCSQTGATYRILVHSFGGTTDAFNLAISADGVSCTAGVPCVATGACCLGGGECVITTAADCASQGGDYMGDNSSCTSPGTEFASTDVPVAMPDLSTVSASITIPAGSGTVSGLRVRIGVTHTFAGDLIATVTHNGATTATLFNRIGRVAAGFGSGDDTVGPYTIFDAATGDIWAAAALPAVTLAAGEYFPTGADSPADTNALAVFDGELYDGTWTLTISDNAGGDIGTLTSFVIERGVINNCDNPCDCDWDNSGALDSSDFFAFLGDFFLGDADFNGSGATDSSDFFDFLGCFFLGC